MPAAASVPSATPWGGDRRWLTDRLLPFALLAVALPITALTCWKTLDWLPPGGRVFPGFFVMENGVVPTVGLFHWTGMTHHMPFAARITAADGKPIRTNGDVYAYVESLPVGTTVEYIIEKDGQSDIRRVPTMRFDRWDYAFTLGIFVLDGVIGLASGFLVSFLRPRSAAARGFLLYGFFWGLFPLTGTALYHPDLAWLSPAYFVAQTVFPATFIHFGLVFPVERPIVRRWPAVLALPYLLSAALLAWIFHSYFATPPSWHPLQATFLYSGVSMPIFFGLLAYAYWENRSPMVRPRLQAIIPAFAVGATVAVYGFLNTGVDGDFPMNLIAITPFVFFGAIAYAILAHDAFDINRVVRRTALYFVLTLTIMAAYAGAVALISVLLPAHDPVASIGVHAGIFVLFALLLQPLRQGLQTLIDITFFRRRLDYRRAVGDVSAALTSVLDLGEIFDRVGRTVADGFALEGFSGVVWSDARTMAWRLAMPTHVMTQMTAPPGFEVLRDRLEANGRRPLVLVDYDTGAAADPELTEALGPMSPALAVPIAAGAKLLGAFLVGAKRSGLAFSRDDLDLLSTLGAQSAIAIQNALSYRSLQELATSLEDRVRERTRALEDSNAELMRKHHEVDRSNEELSRAYTEIRSTQRQLLQSEKMASLGQLVAGVAHEINNPVSFIVGNLPPIEKKLDAIAAAAERHDDPALMDSVARVKEMFEHIGSGAERTAGIVHDLRTFSRIGDAPRSACDLQESIEVALRLLRPKWEQRITIERAYGDVPAVPGVPGQLNQVFMNLLSNACDAIGASGTIGITTMCDGTYVRVAISDDGTGIAETQRDRIFDPFFTTKPQGKGTGLGLSISHGIVEQHGGRIEVESRRGQGSTFTVLLPLTAPPGRQQ